MYYLPPVTGPGSLRPAIHPGYRRLADGPLAETRLIVIEGTFWLLLGMVVYVYAGYPMLLLAVRMLRGAQAVKKGSGEPLVTLIVSAFNERDVIRAKLENCVALRYPRNKLQVLVVSDASDDGTDAIVQNFADRGVTLLRMPERGGKTLGLNAAVQQAGGDILIFSDANAMYRQDAVRKLVRNFDDPEVGAAVGESSYSDSANHAEKSESAYWRYETFIKRLETELGSVVGGDGAIYAIRKSSYRPMAADVLSDFVNPLQIVQQGLRCVYEPEAVSVEEAAGTFEKEYRRKVRIVNRAWRALMRMKSLLNPFRYGLFAWSLISHKLLRWLVPLFLAGILLLNIVLFWQHPIFIITLAAQVLFYALAALAALMRRHYDLGLPLYLPYYFCLVNLASLRGIFEAYRGKTYTIWSPARTASK